MLNAAESAGFGVLITLDKGFEHQQNLEGRSIAVILLKARNSNSRHELAPLFDKALRLVNETLPGTILVIES